MKDIFYNIEENRLRAGWRILLFCVLFWCFSASVFMIKPMLGDLSKAQFMHDYSLLIFGVLTISAIIAVSIARRYLDHRSFISLGLHVTRRSVADLVFGFFLSAFMAAAFFVCVVYSGVVHFESFNSEILPGNDLLSWFGILLSWTLILGLVEFILVGFWEELVFRGYIFKNMKEGMGILLAVVISCLMYGLVHSVNPNATWISTFIIVLFGFLRIYGVLVTKMLWLSMGMHVGWNFFQGPIFGFGVSGHEHASLLQLTFSGPEWLSGGAFGPEGSVWIIPILLLAIIIMYYWSRQMKSKEKRENSGGMTVVAMP